MSTLKVDKLKGNTQPYVDVSDMAIISESFVATAGQSEINLTPGKFEHLSEVEVYKNDELIPCTWDYNDVDTILITNPSGINAGDILYVILPLQYRGMTLPESYPKADRFDEEVDILVDLESDEHLSFHGGEDIGEFPLRVGVNGVLPISKGGIGAGSADDSIFKQKLDRNISVRVGPGEDYETINEALSYLDNYAPPHDNTFRGEIILSSSYEMRETVLAANKNFGWVTITKDPLSINNEVTVYWEDLDYISDIASSITYNDDFNEDPLKQHKSAFVFAHAHAPIISDIHFKLNDNATDLSINDIYHGIIDCFYVVNSNLHINNGDGKPWSRETGATYFTRGIASYFNSYVHADRTTWSYMKYGILAKENSTIIARGVNISYSYRGAYAISGSSIEVNPASLPVTNLPGGGEAYPVLKSAFHFCDIALFASNNSNITGNQGISFENCDKCIVAYKNSYIEANNSTAINTSQYIRALMNSTVSGNNSTIEHAQRQDTNGTTYMVRSTRQSYVYFEESSIQLTPDARSTKSLRPDYCIYAAHGGYITCNKSRLEGAKQALICANLNGSIEAMGIYVDYCGSRCFYAWGHGSIYARRYSTLTDNYSAAGICPSFSGMNIPRKKQFLDSQTSSNGTLRYDFAVAADGGYIDISEWSLRFSTTTTGGLSGILTHQLTLWAYQMGRINAHASATSFSYLVQTGGTIRRAGNYVTINVTNSDQTLSST